MEPEDQQQPPKVSFSPECAWTFSDGHLFVINASDLQVVGRPQEVKNATRKRVEGNLMTINVQHGRGDESLTNVCDTKDYTTTSRT